MLRQKSVWTLYHAITDFAFLFYLKVLSFQMWKSFIEDHMVSGLFSWQE